MWRHWRCGCSRISCGLFKYIFQYMKIVVSLLVFILCSIWSVSALSCWSTWTKLMWRWSHMQVFIWEITSIDESSRIESYTITLSDVLQWEDLDSEIVLKRNLNLIWWVWCDEKVVWNTYIFSTADWVTLSLWWCSCNYANIENYSKLELWLLMAGDTKLLMSLSLYRKRFSIITWYVVYLTIIVLFIFFLIIVFSFVMHLRSEDENNVYYWRCKIYLKRLMLWLLLLLLIIWGWNSEVFSLV